MIFLVLPIVLLDILCVDLPSDTEVAELGIGIFTVFSRAILVEADIEVAAD
jgi:hypothetical protein